MGRQLYEVRVREQSGPTTWVKKSKFYWVKKAGDAARKYCGGGHVMWTKKASKEQLLGIGGFFTLGDRLLKEYAEGGMVDRVLNKIKTNEKAGGYYAKQRKSA